MLCTCVPENSGQTKGRPEIKTKIEWGLKAIDSWSKKQQICLDQLTVGVENKQNQRY